MILSNAFARKILAGLLITSIISFGIFKVSILRFFYVFVSEYFKGITGFIEGFTSLYKSGLETKEWLAHYFLYYPIYLCFHFILIFVLFYNQKFLRKWIMLSLLGILIILVSGKIIFGYLGSIVMAEFFSLAFHNLVALPFILLAIEGGRQIWSIIQQSENFQ